MKAEGQLAGEEDAGIEAALAHQGVILQPTFLVGEDLRAGRLVELIGVVNEKRCAIALPGRSVESASVPVQLESSSTSIFPKRCDFSNPMD